jgi:hypothetical protein
MSFSDVAALATDRDFRDRIAACYSQEQEPVVGGMHPLTWTDTYQFNIAGAPGFGDAYASAIAGGVEFPGKDPAVITDAMLLGAVQALITELETPAAP